MKAFRFLMIFSILGFSGNVWALPITDGLVLHLDADDITDVADGAKIAIWEDLSGMGNNATQPAEANQPIYVAHSANFFDQPVVRFDGVHWMALPPTSVTVGSFTVFAVARFNYTENNQYIMNGQDGEGNDRIRFAWDNATTNTIFEFRAGSTGWMDVTAPADTLVHVFGMTSAIEGFLDGVSLGTSENTSNENPTAFNIGSYNRGEKDLFDGELAEFVLYNRVLSFDEIALLSEFLRVKSNFASVPKPVDGAVDVSRDAALSWTPGEKAQSHRVYLGTDFNDINEANQADSRGVLVSESQSEAIYEPPEFLEFNQTYYWRVDEINDLDPNSPWIGRTWSFATANFIYVEDFESYTDLEPERIFDTWIDGWENEDNGAVVGYADPDFDADKHFVETKVVHGGAQSMPYFYDNNFKYSEAVLPLTASLRDWTDGGVHELSLWFMGYQGYVGSFEESPVGTYTMTSTGTDIWGDFDEFHFAHKEIPSGNVSIIAKVESMDNTDPFAKAGVMIRDTLDPDSRNTSLLITPENGLRFQYRPLLSGDTNRQFDPNVAAPYWVRLERTSGGLVRAFYSEDGSNWSSFTLQVVSMNMPIYVGLAVTSHNVEAVCQATFSNVTITGTGSQNQWDHQDIGIRSNSAESMYVILNDSAVIYHDVPNASQINTWTQWQIPLRRFADLGVNLSNVNSLGIGLGDRNNPQPGGQGIMYFDDIRLYRPDLAE